MWPPGISVAQSFFLNVGINLIEQKPCNKCGKKTTFYIDARLKVKKAENE